MYPLLHKDGLAIPYFVFFGLVSLSIVYLLQSEKIRLSIAFWVIYVVCSSDRKASLMGMILLHAAHALYTPPARFPDVVLLAFAMYSFAHLFVCFVYLHYVQLFQKNRIKIE